MSSAFSVAFPTTGTYTSTQTELPRERVAIQVLGCAGASYQYLMAAVSARVDSAQR